MTSGHMDCPKCGESFSYMRYEKRGVFLKEIEIPEPWKCQKCWSLITVDKVKGYGLLATTNKGLNDKGGNNGS